MKTGLTPLFALVMTILAAPVFAQAGDDAEAVLKANVGSFPGFSAMGKCQMEITELGGTYMVSLSIEDAGTTMIGGENFKFPRGKKSLRYEGALGGGLDEVIGHGLPRSDYQADLNLNAQGEIVSFTIAGETAVNCEM